MGRAIVLPGNRITLLLTASLITGYFIGRWTTKPSGGVDGASGSTSSSFSFANKSSLSKYEADGAFVLLVNMKFATIDHRNTFLKLMEPVCNYVYSNEGPAITSTSTSSSSSGKLEQTTLSYQVAISDKNPLQVLVMERYSDKENGYLTVHKSGKEFLKFREQLKGMQDRGEVVINGESYLETSLGYV
jgi:quinol monooxygenase YgiN